MWHCPHCQSPLQLDTASKSWSCAAGHQFDRAKEGYVNLLVVNQKRSKTPGDSADMLAARRRIHELGLFSPLAEAVVEAVLERCATGLAPQRVLDLGCGEGYYTARLQLALPRAELGGIDIAKTAVKAAAKRYKLPSFAVASTFALPVPSASVDVATRIFAPADDAELVRILRPGGLYLEVTPAAEHLMALRQRLYTNPVAHEPPRCTLEGMKYTATQQISFDVCLDNQQLRDLVSMTPFAHRGLPQRREELLQLESLELGMRFNVTAFTKGME